MIRSISIILFQSTLPQGERHGAFDTLAAYLLISSPAPARGATPPEDDDGDLDDISIHAPARGATEKGGAIMAYRIKISIHAPARGATPLLTVSRMISCDFNPRSRKGSDGDKGTDDRGCRIISIHAPARGATKLPFKIAAASKEISIHAPARGATHKPAGSVTGARFQSTLPQGERRGGSAGGIICRRYFNPRSRKGSDGTAYWMQYVWV